MATDKILIGKSIKYFGGTVFFMFTAPLVLNQAFKNQEHPMFWPVFIIGLLLAIAAIGMGFYSIRILMSALFGPGK